MVKATLFLVLAIIVLTAFFSFLPAHGESVIATIGGSAPAGVAIIPNTNTVYVANEVSGTVSVINENTNTISATIPVGVFPVGIAVNPITNTIYVSNGGSYTLSIIDGNTNTVTATLSTLGYSRYGVAVNSNTNTVYVTSNNENSIYVLNANTNAVSAKIPVGNDPSELAVNPNTNTIYVTNQQSNTVSVINGNTNTVSTTIPVGNEPGTVTVNPNTNTIYVTNQQSNTVSVINGNTNTVSTTIPVGSKPLGMEVNPTTNTLYVSNHGGTTISVIDGNTNTVTRTISVGNNPLGIAIDHSTNTLYVANGGSDTIFVIDGTTSDKDTTPPVITPPSNQVVTTTNSSAVTVQYPPPTAKDNVGISSGPSCNPSPGSSFSLGVTTVTCTASDAAGNVGQATFTVTVQLPPPPDTTPPVVIPPSNQVVTTTNSSGIRVYYPAVIATDNVRISSDPSCNPSSGSIFPLGVTTVTCTASDAAGNVGQATFTVTVQLQSTTTVNSTQNNSIQTTQPTTTQPTTTQPTTTQPTTTQPTTTQPTTTQPTTTQPTTTQPTTISNATPQELASIDSARNDQTIAAEVNVANQAVQTTSIDNNVSVLTSSASTDSLNISVDAPSATGPKVLIVNFAATTVNVANLQDLGVIYDGQSIPPALDIDSILHAKSTDSPSFAIVVTQSGAQILISIPHFSSHSITITNIYKVIPAVPEFGSLAGMIIAISIIGVIVISTRFRFTQKV